MNSTDLETIVEQTFSRTRELLVVKGGEYAGDGDRLANFKRGAALTGCTPLQVAFIYLSKHYDGVSSYVKTSAQGKVRVSSEPIEGRLDDLINYCLLIKAIIAEQTILPDGDLSVDSRGVFTGAGNSIGGIPIIPLTSLPAR